MCEIFIKRNKLDLIFQTITCDARFRQKDQPTQCGFCSSCLLRRQALTFHGIDDKTEYVITHGREPKADFGLHFRAMLRQVDTLRTALGSRRPWTELSSNYPNLSKIVRRLARNPSEAQKLEEDLLRLYQSYVSEWDKVRGLIRLESVNTGKIKIAV